MNADQSACQTLAERTWSALDGLASSDAEYMPLRTRAVRAACAYSTDMAFALHLHGEKALCARMTSGQTRLMHIAAGYLAAGEMGLADEAECRQLAKEAMKHARPMWALTPRERRCVDKELAASWARQTSAAPSGRRHMACLCGNGGRGRWKDSRNC